MSSEYSVLAEGLQRRYGETRALAVGAGPPWWVDLRLSGPGHRGQDAGIAAEDIGPRRPTLDEVFLHLTGRPPAIDSDDRAGPPAPPASAIAQEGASA